MLSRPLSIRKEPRDPDSIGIDVRVTTLSRFDRCELSKVYTDTRVSQGHRSSSFHFSWVGMRPPRPLYPPPLQSRTYLGDSVGGLVNRDETKDRHRLVKGLGVGEGGVSMRGQDHSSLGSVHGTGWVRRPVDTSLSTSSPNSLPCPRPSPETYKGNSGQELSTQEVVEGSRTDGAGVSGRRGGERGRVRLGPPRLLQNSGVV